MIFTKRFPAVFFLTGVLSMACPGLLTAQSVSELTKVESVVIILRPHGFEPAEVEIPPGPTAIHVYNRVGKRQLSLRLGQEIDAPGGEKLVQNLRQEDVIREQKKWRNFFDLAPGTYVITEENHPKWSCRISVTERKR